MCDILYNNIGPSFIWLQEWVFVQLQRLLWLLQNMTDPAVTDGNTPIRVFYLEIGTQPKQKREVDAPAVNFCISEGALDSGITSQVARNLGSLKSLRRFTSINRGIEICGGDEKSENSDSCAQDDGATV